MNYRINEWLARAKSSTSRGNYRGIGRANLTVLVLVALVAFGLISAMPAEAATITVCGSGCNYMTIQDAVTNASSGDTICIQDATHDEYGITVSQNVTIEGESPTNSDCSGAAGTTVDGGGLGRVFTVDSGVTATLKDLTIQGGSINRNGGGVYNSGDLTVDDCTFQDNTAGTPTQSKFGGAIYMSTGATTIATNSTFSGNKAYQGGAIYNNSGSNGKLTVTNCTFSGNGGIIFGGGAIYNNTRGTLIATNTTFSGNQALGGGGSGGAILNTGGAPKSATATATNCTFSNNAARYGGAIEDINGAKVTVTNCTFSGNSGSGRFGGGIDVFGAVADVKSSIFASQPSGSGEVGGNCSNGGPVTDKGYNISDDDTCKFTATGTAGNGDDVDPTLDTNGLQNNGGPTETVALLQGSPAIDAIPLADCTDQSSPTPLAITTDQRGLPRPDPVDGPEGNCDIGAYEYQDTFAGTPSAANCHGKSVSALAREYGGMDAAAAALGYPSVEALQAAITAYCGG